MGDAETETGEWLRRAEIDLQVAEHILANPNLPADVACFHLQQAVEKAVKGILVAFNTSPPRTHDLRALNAMLPAGQLQLDADALEALTPFAVLSRYPGFGAQPSPDLVRTFRNLAHEAIKALQNVGEDEG